MKLKTVVLSLAAVAMLSACGGSNNQNVYTTSHFCTFDFSNADQICGSDNTFFSEPFYSGQVFAFLNKVSDDKTRLLGGFALVGQADDVLDEDHVAAPLCVYGTGYKSTKYYATYVYSNDMPEHSAVFLQAGSGSLSLVGVYVNNTNRMVNIAHHGLPAHDEEPAIPAFAEGDYLKVRFVSNSGSTSSGSGTPVEFTLAEYADGRLSVCDDWTLVNLEALGKVNTLDIQLLSNRKDLPLAFCIDNLEIVAHVNL